MTDKELLQQALDILEDWDSLIQHQYNGSKEAMSDLTVCAQSTPPIIEAIKARLAQPEPDWMKKAAEVLHYPECWDTAAYPTLDSAIHETLAWSECSTCKEAQPDCVCGELDSEGVHRKDNPCFMINGLTKEQTNKTMSVKGLIQPKKEWVGLTEEEIWHLSQFNCGTRGEFARAIEAKLKEKNT